MLRRPIFCNDSVHRFMLIGQSPGPKQFGCKNGRRTVTLQTDRFKLRVQIVFGDVSYRHAI